MKRADQLWLGALVLGAGLIWLHDLAWLPSAGDTLPILVALPLFAWFGGPWRWRPEGFRLHRPTLALAGVALAAGSLLDLTLLLAVAWTLALWSWLRERFVCDPIALRQLAWLPLMAFPWLTLDFAPLGWWFRLSASWVTGLAYFAAGFAVTQQGTNLLVHGLPIEVAPACSGMNALQAMLIAGFLLVWLKLRGTRWFWLAVATLPALAWLANALRVCATVAVALSWGADFAGGKFHEPGGWLVLMLVFAAWWWLLNAGHQRLAARGNAT